MTVMLRLGAMIMRLATLSLAVSWSIAATAGPKPAVPAGTDPGGVAVAILGPGLDYTVPEIAARLARDGEGDPIGRDFEAGDNRPYEPPDANGARPGTTAALILVRLVERVRLVAVREHPADPAAIGRMLAFTTQSPAMIAVWPEGAPSRHDWPILTEAARRFPDRLIIVPAPVDPRALAKLPRLPNLVFAAHGGRLAAGRAPRGIIVPKATQQETPSDVAASFWVAALAARTLALSPGLDAASLSRLLTAMAHPQR